MELRVLKRRDLTGSMTIVGDMGQATTASSSASWNSVLEVLDPRREPTRVDLTVSYRTPEEVLDFAAPTLLAATPDLEPPRPVRRAGFTPIVDRVSPDEFADALVAATRREVAAVAPGRVAVIVIGRRVDEVIALLCAAGVDAVDPRDHDSKGLGAGLVVLSAEGANGLEFDAIDRGRTGSDREPRVRGPHRVHAPRSAHALRRHDPSHPAPRHSRLRGPARLTAVEVLSGLFARSL